MADKKITQLVDGGAPQATDEFVIARGGDNFKVDYASLESETLNDAVILAPASSARNVIQPTAGAVIAAIVKAHAAQSVDLTQWQQSNGTPLITVGPTAGVAFTLTDANTTPISITGLGTSALSGLVDLFEVKLSDGLTRTAVGPDGYLYTVGQIGDTSDLMEFVSALAGLVIVRFDGSMQIQTDVASAFAALHLQGGVAANPQLLIRNGTLPADAFFAANQLGLWYDATNGAAKVGFKGKTADGTVVTWTIPSFPGGTTLFMRADGTFAAPPSGAPTTATYITQTPDATLSAEQALSLLATGLVKNTTTTGVLSIAAQGTDYYAPGGTDVAVADGGTGASTASGARTNLGLVIDTDVASMTTANAKVPKSLFDANTVLAADTDDTPAAVTMGASTILARLAAGNIKAASVSEINTLLGALSATIIDAKGDLIAGTANDTAARLAVGANGKLPMADSNSTPGIRWATTFSQPWYIAGGYYGYIGSYDGSGSGMVLNTLYALPIFIGRRQAFDQIALRCGVGTATLVVRLGIYSDNGSAGPDALVLDAGTIDGASATALKAITISQTLDAGLYWLCAVGQVAATIGSIAFVRALYGETYPLQRTAGAGAASSVSFFRTSITGALPANLTPVAADYENSSVLAPRVVLRAA